MTNNVVYMGVFLDDDSRRYLLSTYPPKHSRILADHVTLKFRPTIAEVSSIELGTMISMKVTGYAEDEKGQALIVELLRADENVKRLMARGNKHTHITISVSEGISPVYSNVLLESRFDPDESDVVDTGQKLMGVIDTFPRSV